MHQRTLRYDRDSDVHDPSRAEESGEGAQNLAIRREAKSNLRRRHVDNAEGVRRQA